MNSTADYSSFEFCRNTVFIPAASSAIFENKNLDGWTSQLTSIPNILDTVGRKIITPQHVQLIVGCMAILYISPLTYLLTTLLSELKRRRLWWGCHSPPILPYWFFYLGSVYDFLADGPNLCKRLVALYGSKIPMGIRTGPFTFYFVTEPSQVYKILQPPKELWATASTTAPRLNRILGLPWSAVHALRYDDSGPFNRPLRGATTPANARVRSAAWVPSHKYLLGENARNIGMRYSDMLSKQLNEDYRITHTWTGWGDLFEYLQDSTMPASFGALFGTSLFRLYPEFPDCYTSWLANISFLIRGWPRLLRPSVQANRTKVLSYIKGWHRYLKHHPEAFNIGPNEASWNEHIGSEYARAHLQALQALDEKTFGPDATAGFVLGSLFASNANALAVMFWTLFEVVRDPKLMQRVRDIIESAGESEMADLAQHPLLRSIFTEVTRMRVVGLIMRRPKDQDYVLDGWTYPKDSLICASSHHASLNEDVWNIGSTDDPHPLDQFWADRFIIYPDKADSGPLRPELEAKYNIQTLDKQGVFSLEGLKGTYFPFGAGPSQCPGRDLARFEVINTLVVFIKTFDIELTAPLGWCPAMDSAFFPTGTLPPKDKTPFRIRRRDLAE